MRSAARASASARLPIRVGTRRSSPPRPRMRSAGGTNGDGVMPMLVHTPVMSFSMSTMRLCSIGSTGVGMNRSNERMRRCSRSMAWPNMISTSALARCCVPICATALPAIFRQSRMRADGQVRAAAPRRRRWAAWPGNMPPRPRRTKRDRGRRCCRTGTIVVVGTPSASNCG